jgi:hypothetical protein
MLTSDFGASIAHKITRHGEDEVGVGAEHLGQEFINHLQHLRPESNGLRRNGGDNAIGRPLQEVPAERAANAEAQHHELVDQAFPCCSSPAD